MSSSLIARSYKRNKKMKINYLNLKLLMRTKKNPPRYLKLGEIVMVGRVGVGRDYLTDIYFHTWR